MKKNSLYPKYILAFIFTILIFQGYSQTRKICDTCTYTHELFKPPVYTDTVKPYYPISYSEYGPCGSESEKRKNITFVHGLGGSAASWDKAKTWTDDNYKTAVMIANYNGAGWESSFHSVALKLNDDIGGGLKSGINQRYPDRCPDDDFVIAHSQGGIASRYLDRQWDLNPNGTFGNRKFRGIVTFGTPHGGSDIALTRNEHAAYIRKVASAIYLESTYNYRGIFKKIDNLIDSTEVFIEKSLVPFMLAGEHTNTLDQMAPGSSTMNELNSHNSRVHKVAFYGIENEPECWRTMDNFAGNPVEKFDLFSAVNDEEFMKKAESVRFLHQLAIEENNAELKTLKTLATLPFGQIISFVFELDYLQKLKRYTIENEKRHEAIEFLNNANTEWRYLIGSYHRDSITTDTIKEYLIKWEEKYGLMSKWYSQKRVFYEELQAFTYFNQIDKNVYKVKNKTISTNIKIVKQQTFFPSDGIVLVKSQIAFPGVKDRIDEMKENNHLQMRNSPETKRVMENLFIGFYDKYFITNKR